MICLKFRRRQQRHTETNKHANTHTKNFAICESQVQFHCFFTLPVGVKAELLKEQSKGTKIVAAPGRLLCAPLTGLAKISIVSYL